jgi:hypothetical protein
VFKAIYYYLVMFVRVFGWGCLVVFELENVSVWSVVDVCFMFSYIFYYAGLSIFFLLHLFCKC